MNQSQSENVSSTEMTAVETALQRIEIGDAYPRHIKLSVDLRDLRHQIEGDVFEEVRRIFPGITDFGPNPLTIGGLPFTIGDQAGNGRGLLMRPSPPGDMRIRLCKDIKWTRISFETNAFRQSADRVNKEVQELALEFQIVECIISSDGFMYVILPDEIDLSSVHSKIPGRVANCWTTPLNERDVHRPSKQAQLVTISSTTNSTTNDVGSDSEFFLDHPLTGNLEGIILARSWRPILDTQAYVIFDWVYLGQGHGENLQIPDSVCGTPVRDSNGIRGHFQYHVSEGRFEGFYAAVRADEVARDGVMLVL
ncbi:hypothetical protein CC79DRAFT_1401811 [Sarocladium strictum]